jgi:diguanylate cyclase (GGDEF)-like protein
MTYGGSRRPDLAARLSGSERALKRRLESALGYRRSHEAVQLSPPESSVAAGVEARVSFGAGLQVRLTVSIGVATLPDVAASAEARVKAADTAMYRVKGSGKNGVRIARPDDTD